uniref:Uncharacterized protein n=1 Tax=Oryza sativa subsp. japonica TaxID=39947 RepID=Q8GVJ6_ORYSJ|nr:hypothetical protein [Oryza sativa Japonica Group]
MDMEHQRQTWSSGGRWTWPPFSRALPLPPPPVRLLRVFLRPAQSSSRSREERRRRHLFSLPPPSLLSTTAAPPPHSAAAVPLSPPTLGGPSGDGAGGKSRAAHLHAGAPLRPRRSSSPSIGAPPPRCISLTPLSGAPLSGSGREEEDDGASSAGAERRRTMSGSDLAAWILGMPSAISPPSLFLDTWSTSVGPTCDARNLWPVCSAFLSRPRGWTMRQRIFHFWC